MQWLYRPEESKYKNSKFYPAQNPRSLLYSFHVDEAAADAVLHKCIVRLIPPNRQLPDPVMYPGFVVQYVYDVVNKMIYPVTDKDFGEVQQKEIDMLLIKSKMAWELLPIKEEKKIPANPLPEKPFIPRNKRSRGKKAKEEDEFKGIADDPDVVELPKDELERKMLEFGAISHVKLRDQWRKKLSGGFEQFCKVISISERLPFFSLVLRF